MHAWPEDIARYRGKYKMGWDALRRSRFKRQKELGLFAAELRLAPRNPESYPWEEEADPDDMDLRMAVFAAMVDRIDQGIGQILEALRETGEEDDTLILFLSDNGGCAEPYGMAQRGKIEPGGPDSAQGYYLPWANASNTPFRLFKHWTHEGGVATPFIAVWPGKTPAGKIHTRQIGHVKDLMPTLLDAAGADYPTTYNGERIQPLEGVSLLPAILDPETVVENTVYWEHEGNRAVRDGDWKLVSYYNETRERGPGNGRRTGPWELYNLAVDRTELRDLSAIHPRKAAELQAQWEDWANRVGVIDWDELMQLTGDDRAR